MSYIELGNAQIQHANDAYCDLIGSGIITDREILDIAHDRVVSEQQRAIESMSEQFNTELELATKIPQNDLDRLGEIHKEIDRLEGVNEQVGYLELYYPGTNDEILSDNTSKLSSLKNELARLSLREVSIEDYPHLYSPWTIPVNKTINAADIERKYTQLLGIHSKNSDLDEVEGVIADPSFEYIFPYDKVCPQKEGASFSRKYPEQVLWDASTYTAYLLSTSPGRVWTCAEIGNQLYADQGLGRDTEASRASALLSSAATGKVEVIKNELNKLGLVLQFGLAYKIDGNGARYGRGQRVARALDISRPYEDAGGNGLGVEWDSVKYHDQPQEVGSTIEDMDEPVTEAYRGIKEDINRLIPLVTSVKEGANLLVIGAKIGSRTVGTKENLRRVHEAGLINREEMLTGVVKNPDAIIMAAMYNSHKRLLNSPKHLKNIKNIIEKSIADYTKVND